MDLLDLPEDACRWPIGDRHPFHYCGEPKAPWSWSYCDRHHALAYTTPPRRRVLVDRTDELVAIAKAEAAA